jgi:hypothetical protein
MPKFALFLSAALCGTFAAAQQMSCPATTSSVIGSYGYVANQLPLSGVVLTPPGTNPPNSNTPIGNLIENINTGAEFWSAGILYFDGAGNIAVGASTQSVGAATVVGSYTVNSDCTINVTLTDVFNTRTITASGVATPTMASTSLIGLVLGGGAEIALSAAQSLRSTNGNTPVIPGAFASRLVLQLTKSLTYCSASSLVGTYGLVGTGFAPSNTAGAPQPAGFFASLAFDSNGNVTAQMTAPGSPLASFQLTGTYSVNLDCSGTMKLSGAIISAGSGTTAGTPTFLVDFVLTPPLGAVTLSGYATRPGIEFTLWNSTETFFGTGTAQ